MIEKSVYLPIMKPRKTIITDEGIKGPADVIRDVIRDKR